MIRAVMLNKPICLFMVVLIVCAIDLRAQFLYDTTLTIPEVTINAPRPWHFRDDIKTDVFTSEKLQSFEGESLGRFLIGNTALNVKTYGTGGALASVSLRGSSTSHVQVNWNGFPINSVTHASCDFSMIPATGFDRISVVYSAPGALYGSGTFGGAINLDDNMKLEKTLSGSASISYESLKTLSGNTTTTVGNDKMVWKSNIWGTVSENEFSYYDYIRQSNRKQTDGSWNNTGTIQQVKFRLFKNSTLETGLWYQIKNYNIPSRIGSVLFESQKDSTLKFYTAYKTSANRWGLQVKAAVFNDYQRYTQKASAESSEYSIDSKFFSHQYYGDANFRYYLRQWISVDAGVTASYITADVSAYGGTQKEKGITAFAGAKYERNELTVQAGIRNEVYTDYHSGLLPSLGIAWEMIPDKHTLRFNISKKYRKPSFNDLFWLPGGNPDLKPESGFSVEAGSALTLLEKKNVKMTADIGTYWSQIDNMIVWTPDGAYWTAKNYQRVRSGGMDGNMIFDLIRGRYKYHSSLMVMLNRSAIKTYTGKREKMLYSPGIITSWENRFTAGIIDLKISHHFTADRFYEENSLLKPFQTIDIQTGIRIPMGKGKLGIYATVNNLTNTTYELIRLYPMPGRYLSVKINYSY